MITIKMLINRQITDVQIKPKQTIGQFAIHRQITHYDNGVQYTNRYWTITDIPTGMILCNTRSIIDARAICRKVMVLCTDTPFSLTHSRINDVLKIIIVHSGTYY
jgi:hypothetical protein